MLKVVAQQSPLQTLMALFYGLLFLVFGPAFVTLILVYFFPVQYHWLVEATKPLSLAIISSVMPQLHFLMGDEQRFSYASEVAFSGDNLFGCYIGVVFGAFTTWLVRGKRPAGSDADASAAN